MFTNRSFSYDFSDFSFLGKSEISFCVLLDTFIILLLCWVVKWCPVSEAKRMFFIVAYIGLPQKCLIALKGTEKAEWADSLRNWLLSLGQAKTYRMLL